MRNIATSKGGEEGYIRRLCQSVRVQYMAFHHSLRAIIIMRSHTFSARFHATLANAQTLLPPRKRNNTNVEG